MRFMMFVRADKNTEAGVLPRPELIAAMGRFNEAMMKAGVMLAGEGIQPSSKGARVTFSRGTRTVTFGPFPDKELVAGFWMIQVKSKDEAIEWAKRVPFADGEVIEIRQVFEGRTFLPRSCLPRTPRVSNRCARSCGGSVDDAHQGSDRARRDRRRVRRRRGHAAIRVPRGADGHHLRSRAGGLCAGERLSQVGRVEPVGEDGSGDEANVRGRAGGNRRRLHVDRQQRGGRRRHDADGEPSARADQDRPRVPEALRRHQHRGGHVQAGRRSDRRDVEYGRQGQFRGPGQPPGRGHGHDDRRQFREGIGGAEIGGGSSTEPVTMSTTNNARATTFTTPSDREIAMTRVVDAPRGLVFEAWTKPEHPPHWMLGPSRWDLPVCEIDLRPGGAWHFVWRRSDGTEMGMRGVYREIAPPERLVATESWGGDWPETLNTLVLSEKDARTTITQTMFYPSREARDAALGTGMKEGASESFDRLDEYLRGRSGSR